MHIVAIDIAKVFRCANSADQNPILLGLIVAAGFSLYYGAAFLSRRVAALGEAPVTIVPS